MSGLKRTIWNTVVVGKWNPAILSPQGIAVQIFGKAKDVPFEVLVPLDAMGPPKVRIDGYTVVANFEKLVIDSAQSDWEFLDKSRELCLKAIEELPKTPVSAAGYNIRYDIEDPSGEFLELVKPPLDNKITDNGFEILSKEIRKTLRWGDGAINIHITKRGAANFQLLLNFDRMSADNRVLKDWLAIPIEEVRNVTRKIISSVLKLCEGEKI
jgi:hypothetical protein